MTVLLRAAVSVKELMNLLTGTGNDAPARMSAAITLAALTDDTDVTPEMTITAMTFILRSGTGLLQISAMRALDRLTMNDEPMANRIAAAKAIEPLVVLLGQGIPDKVQTAAAWTLGNLVSHTAENRVTAAVAIPQLIRLIRLPGLSRTAAKRCLANLMLNNETNKIAAAPVIMTLIGLLASGNNAIELRSNAARALRAVVIECPANQTAAMPAIKPLVAMLEQAGSRQGAGIQREGTEALRKLIYIAVFTLYNLVRNHAANAAAAAPAIPYLIPLLAPGIAQEVALFTLHNLVQNHAANAAAAAPAIPYLIPLLAPGIAQEVALSTLHYLVKNNAANQAAVAPYIARLVPLLAPGINDVAVQNAATTTLAHVVGSNAARQTAAAHAIPHLKLRMVGCVDPNVLQHILILLATLTRANAANQAAAAGTISDLTRLMAGTPGNARVVRILAASTLGFVVCNNAVCRAAAVEGGAVLALVRLMMGAGCDASVETAAASALWRFGVGGLVTVDVIVTALTLMIGARHEAREHAFAAAALDTLVADKVATRVQAASAIEPLAKLLGPNNADSVQAVAARTLGRIVKHDAANQATAAAVGAPDALRRLLVAGASSSTAVRESAAWALFHCRFVPESDSFNTKRQKV